VEIRVLPICQILRLCGGADEAQEPSREDRRVPLRQAGRPLGARVALGGHAAAELAPLGGDWLEQVKVDGKPWDKTPPAPHLPQEVIAKTAAKYREALDRLTG